jgi:hypothetical protein
VGAAGGILTAWDSKICTLAHSSEQRFSLTTSFSPWPMGATSPS